MARQISSADVTGALGYVPIGSPVAVPILATTLTITGALPGGQILASPASASGAPTFRAITAQDIALATTALTPSAFRAPTPLDDTAHGYTVGQFWNGPTGVFQSLQNTAGQAVWQPFPGSAPLPVNAVGGAAPLAAYGMRLLVASYAGKAFNIVRASDSTALDVGFLATGALDTASLDAFLSGTTGRIATWYDQSGNGNHATQTTAAYRPTVVASNLIGNSRSIVFDTVVSAGTATQEGLVIPNTLTCSGTAASAVVLARSTCVEKGSTLLQLYNASYPMTLGSSSYNGMSLSYGPLFNLGLLAPSTAYTTGFSSGSSVRFFTEDVTGTFAGTGAQTQTGGMIGATTTYSTTGYCEIAAVLIYGRAISQAEQDAAQSSLYGVFGLAPQTRSSVLFIGDSITELGFATLLRSYPRKVEPLLVRPARILNGGVWGDTLVDLTTIYAAWYAPVFNAAWRDNICFIFAGTNDISNTGADAPTTYGRLQTLVADAKATGFKVIVGTMLPRTSLTTGEQTIWNAYNALIRANWAAIADGLADFQADPTMGPFAASSNTALYADGTHPTDLGMNYLAQIAAAAVNALLVL